MKEEKSSSGHLPGGPALQPPRAVQSADPIQESRVARGPARDAAVPVVDRWQQAVRGVCAAGPQRGGHRGGGHRGGGRTGEDQVAPEDHPGEGRAEGPARQDAHGVQRAAGLWWTT